MAFVVIVHLDPTQKSHMAELLQRDTAMRVQQVTRVMAVEPNNVYIIPPDKDLTLADGHFRLTTRAEPNRSRAPIDGFFRTLAQTHDADAIGIVLSGTGSDGTQGIRWIKEKGGVTMAQSPDDAEYRAMPESAIATGLVDVVLPASQLGGESARFRHGHDMNPPTPGTAEAAEDERAIADIIAAIRAATGHDFTEYKRTTLDRRIRRRSQFAHAAQLGDYLAIIRANREELNFLYDDLLISVTSFFRDREAFAKLARDVVPRLFQGRGSEDTIRIWVTGCSTGEEAYSLSILMCEYAETLSAPPIVQIFATDVHDRGFAHAREGAYPESIAADVSPERLERFFTRIPGGYKVRKLIREKVIFAVHNLLKDPPFLRVDLVSCRNVLIYLDRDAQRRLFKLFYFALRPGGTLFLGSSESVEDLARLFEPVDKKNRIFESRRSATTPVSPHIDRLETPNAAPAKREHSENPQQTASAQRQSLAAGHRKLLEEYAPPSLVVNQEGDVVHLSENVGRYLRLGAGQPTSKLLEMLPRAARPRLRQTLSRVFSTGRSAEVSGVSVPVGRERHQLNLLLRLLPGRSASESLALIVFDDAEPSSSPPPATAGPLRKSERTKAVREMEGELSELRSQLRVTSEEHEATIEELKASNEELQSINEEQRATEEELEASKEELQSINEELQTINQEFRTKNEQLAELNADLGNLINSTDIATIFLDRNLRVRRYTPAVGPLFKLLPGDLGRPLEDMSHQLEYDGLLDDAREVMRSLGSIEREIRDRRGAWYSARISAYRSVEDKIDGVVISFVDITDRKTADLERDAMFTEVQAASVAKSNFIGVMSHELRTPLNAILGYADILMAGAVGPVSEDQQRHLERIKSSATHLAHMIDDSLQSVRIEAGITSIDEHTVDVAALVREVAIASAPLMQAKKLRFDVTAEDGPTIISDPTRIRQILFNLLGNAVRYTDNGTVSIWSKVDEHGAMIAVEDTGIGISSENLDKIFERFWQVDQSKTRLRGGAGLGLMVSRSLARLMGGELDVASELGKGSRFVVRLPLRKA
jgi:two-component system CheB/CheR fusion protein